MIRYNGDKIKKARILQDMTQEDLAQKAGVVKSTISILERNLCDKPRRSTLESIANSLGLKYDDITSTDSEYMTDLFVDYMRGIVATQIIRYPESFLRLDMSRYEMPEQYEFPSVCWSIAEDFSIKHVHKGVLRYWKDFCNLLGFVFAVEINSINGNV